MATRIFVAGATGAIGRRLVPLLLDAGHAVIGATRSAEKAATLRDAGAEAVVVDVFDAPVLIRAVKNARPEVVIHQLTDLPYGLDPARMAEARVRNSRIRSEGIRNLVEAALAAGAKRLIAQSIAWGYLPGPEPHGEGDPLDVEGAQAQTMAGVVALEQLTLNSPPLQGIVLRYWRSNRVRPGSTILPKVAPIFPRKRLTTNWDGSRNSGLKIVRESFRRKYCSPIVPQEQMMYEPYSQGGARPPLTKG